MTFRAKLECDARDCQIEYELDQGAADVEIEIENTGWFEDYENFSHYCPKCTKKAKLELGVN